MTSAESAPRISVIIPVYRDWADLRRCLAALAQQTWPVSDFEILVVNNDTQPAPDDLAAPNLRLLQEPQGHSYAARNAGVAAARGALLAFTDADCQPAPDWLAAGWAALQGEADLAGGQIEISREPAGLAADYERCFAFPQEQNAHQGRSVTANLFVRRRVFASSGGFDATLQSGGDFEFCQRAGRAGHRLVYAAEARVLHPPRSRIAALLKKNRRTAGGFRRREFELAGLDRAAQRRVLGYLLRPRPLFWWRVLRGRERSAHLGLWRRLQVVLLNALLQYHFALSVLRQPPSKDQHG